MSEIFPTMEVMVGRWGESEGGADGMAFFLSLSRLFFFVSRFRHTRHKMATFFLYTRCKSTTLESIHSVVQVINEVTAREERAAAATTAPWPLSLVQHTAA